METDAGKSQVAYARLAGAMFLAVDGLDAISLVIAGRFRVPGDVLETGHRILQSEALYRAALASGLAGALCTALLAVGLWGALRQVDGKLAVTGLVFRVAEATLFGVLAIVSFGFLRLYTGAAASGFSASQLSTIAAVRSAAGDAGFNIAALFFGIGSTVFFYLFLKSSYIPRWLALLGFVGSLLVPVACFGALVFRLSGPGYWALWGPVGAAEVIGGLWLLIKGLDLRPDAAAADLAPVGHA